MNFDITFCSKNNCPNRECERNQVNLNELDYKINHIWVGNFIDCEHWKKVEEENE